MYNTGHYRHRVPNQPATPLMCFRIPPPLRAEIERIAGDRAESLTEFAIRAFEREVRLYPIDED